jgi:3-deoxy-manno-octulosonate cytidylyltransferase (CMP-KDO synthetase)
MSFTVLIPARLASTRLPGKPLANIAGLPMIVRVAQRAALSAAHQVVVAADHADILQACETHGISAILTSCDHPTGSDRLAQACNILGLGGVDVVVNVQGDEPLINPQLINACAALLAEQPDCVMSTAAHAITSASDLDNPNIVKVVLDAAGRALYFSRAPIPWWREGRAASAANATTTPIPAHYAPLRHIGLYAYKAGFLRRFPELPVSPLETVEALEQLRVLWHGERIAVHVTNLQPGLGVDTPEDLARVQTFYSSAA